MVLSVKRAWSQLVCIVKAHGSDPWSLMEKKISSCLDDEIMDELVCIKGRLQDQTRYGFAVA